MIINFDKTLCENLDFVDFEEKTILSFELNKQAIKEKLQNLGVQKIYNFDDIINFDIEIDSTPDFNSANLKQINFRDLQCFVGHRVCSCIIEIAHKQEDEELTFYYRVKVNEQEKSYQIKENDWQTTDIFGFVNDWSETCEVKIKQNYTLNIIKAMYDFIADRNSYNKEVYSANFYSFLFPHAKEFNKAYNEILKTKEMFILQKCDTNYLNEVFGYNYGFNIPFNINTEEYRRILMTLRRSYISAGTFTSIANVLYYFTGEKVVYKDFKNIYPWILREKEVEYDHPSYTNYKSNYYLYNINRLDNEKAKNEIMLLDDDFAKFNFIIKGDNFYNYDIDTYNILTIINKLKPVYTKCILSIDEKEDYNPTELTNCLLVDDDYLILFDNEIYGQYA